MTIFSLIIMLTLAGCGERTGGPVETAEPAIPEMIIVIDGQEYRTAVGPYCWQSGNSAVCADKEGDPFAYEESVPPITGAPGEEATLKFEQPPDSFSVKVQDEHGRDISQSGEPILLPGADGKYGYSVTGVWPQGEVTFLFVVRVKPHSPD
ncbi:hypothetical protein [Bhargavaea ullalensis]|uniref:Lipoprotein n=1 Tax=Bhargavaea ullalensis TaxID=1265685 RepID=A0ABV2GAN3_9BACL